MTWYDHITQSRTATCAGLKTTLPQQNEGIHGCVPIFRIQQQQRSVFFLKTPPSKENQQGHAMHLLPIVALLSSLVKDKPCSQSSLLSIGFGLHSTFLPCTKDVSPWVVSRYPERTCRIFYKPTCNMHSPWQDFVMPMAGPYQTTSKNPWRGCSKSPWQDYPMSMAGLSLASFIGFSFLSPGWERSCP